jgi:hypothetical protein
LRAKHQHPARGALLQMSFQHVLIQPPEHGACWDKQELPVWVVRVWEPEPPAGAEPLEWLLVTTVPVTTTEQAWQRVQWYGWRWLAEDFHHALKTGWKTRATADAQRGGAVRDCWRSSHRWLCACCVCERLPRAPQRRMRRRL